MKIQLETAGILCEISMNGRNVYLEKTATQTILLELSYIKCTIKEIREMPSYAESLPPQDRKRYVLYAYASTWFGCFADVMMDCTALIVIYFVLLKTSNSLIMFSSAIAGLVQIPLLIPASMLVDRFGVKRMVCVSCLMSCAGYCTMAVAPFAGSFAQYVMLAGVFIFSSSRPIWSSSWYPVLSDILLPEERGTFFGRMRFSYYILTGTVFYFVGLIMGKTPPVWYLQVATCLTGILALGRFFFINKIKLSDCKNSKFELKKSFSISIHNSPLVGFSTYCCFFSLAISAIIPLALIYLKQSLGFDAGTVQKLSTMGIAGSVSGFLLYGWVQKKMGMRNLQISVHILWIFVALGFFCCFKGMPMLMPFTALLLFLSYLGVAWFNCCFSQECLALSRPGNTAMAAALANTYNNIGNAVGRTAGSLLLGHGLLASSWQWNGLTVTNFQSIFLFCAAGAVFCLVLLFNLPSVISTHDNYYKP